MNNWKSVGLMVFVYVTILIVGYLTSEVVKAIIGTKLFDSSLLWLLTPLSMIIGLLFILPNDEIIRLIHRWKGDETQHHPPGDVEKKETI